MTLRSQLLLQACLTRVESACHLLRKDPHLLDWDQWTQFLSTLAQKATLHDGSWVAPFVETLQSLIRPERCLPEILWTRIWELLQNESCAHLHRWLWILATDWVRATSTCSLYTWDRHWRNKPEQHDILLSFLARLLEEQHLTIQLWEWDRIRQIVQPVLSYPDIATRPHLHYGVFCVLANWVCGHPERGERLRQSPVWAAQIWEIFAEQGLDTPLGTAAFQVLCNAAGPSLHPRLEDQWKTLQRCIWDRAATVEPLLLRRSIHFGQRLIRSTQDVYTTARLGVLARLVRQFGHDPVLQADVATCFTAWKVYVPNAALWTWVTAASGWDAVTGTEVPTERS